MSFKGNKHPLLLFDEHKYMNIYERSKFAKFIIVHGIYILNEI